MPATPTSGSGWHTRLATLYIICHNAYLYTIAQWASVTGRGGGGGGPRYISRLECIKEAISRHMDHLAVTEPNSKVALVTFDNKV